MANPPPRRWWKFWTWFAAWAWWERALLAMLTLAPLLALAIGGRGRSGSAGLLALLAFFVLQIIVYRHGGWGLLGPHFYYDVVRLARRGRSTLLRVAYILAMFAGLTAVYESASPGGEAWHQNDFARVSERFAFALFVVQNLAIFVLTPAYLGSALAEEKERRTLELLFTTQLTNKEIVLGKLFSRVIHLFGFVLAGLPILSLIQFWGGIDLLVVAGNLANTALNILTLGSFCLYISALLRTVSGAVMTCYVLVLPPSFCCLAGLNGFPFVLQDERWGETGVVTVQDLGFLLIGHLGFTLTFLAAAMTTLRGYQLFATGPTFSPVRLDPTLPKNGRGTKIAQSTAIQTEAVALRVRPIEREPTYAEEPLDDLAIPYALPPVEDDALWWKERFVGGPPFALSPVVLVPAIPFVATSTGLLLSFAVHAWTLPRAEYLAAVEHWGYMLRFFYYVFVGCYLLGVAYRATAAIARERQQQTLDPLLLLPIERAELLRAKWLGCVWRGWPWLALVAGDLALGTLVGSFHPFSTLLLALAVLPLIAFFASLGMLLSIVMTTVMRANLVMVIVFVFLICGTTAAVFGDSHFAYVEALTFSWQRWQRIDAIDLQGLLIAIGLMIAYALAGLACWKLALRYFEDRSNI